MNRSQIITYFRNCLIDDECLSLENQGLLSGYNVELEDLFRGVLPLHVYQHLQRTLGLKLEEKPLFVVISPVVLIEKDVYGKSEKYIRTVFSPLYVPAILKADGKLCVPEQEEPWISRNHLRPNFSEDFPLWGSHEAYQEFIKFQGTLKNCDTWKRYIDKCARMLEESCNFTLKHVPPGFDILGSKIVAFHEPNQNKSRGVRNLYSSFLEQKSTNLLLDKVFDIKEESEQQPLDDSLLDDHFIMSTKTVSNVLNHAESQFLSTVEKAPDGELLAGLYEGEQASSGVLQSLVFEKWVQAALDQTLPPILFFSSDKPIPSPELISLFKVGLEDGNDSFYRRWLPDIKSYGTLTISLSEFMKNKHKLSGLHIYLDPEKKFPSLDTESYYEKGLSAYLHAARGYFGSTVSLSEAIEKIHSELESEVDQLNQCVVKAKSYQRIASLLPATAEQLLSSKEDILQQLKQKIQSSGNQLKSFRKHLQSESDDLSFFSKMRSRANDQEYEEISRKRRGLLSQLGISIPEETDIMNEQEVLSIMENTQKKLELTLEQIQPQFERLETNLQIRNDWIETAHEYGLDPYTDTLELELNKRFRHKIFFLATHYWEGTYLKTLKNILDKEKEGQLQGRKRVVDDWQLRAMITPCFFSSFDELPRSFYLHINNYTTLIKDIIDLLIIDCGDDVSPYLAIPSLVFAKKCVVLGHSQRDSRSHKLPLGVERGNLTSCGLDSANIEEQLTKQGTFGELQSMTALATWGCRYFSRPDERGIFLDDENAHATKDTELKATVNM